MKIKVTNIFVFVSALDKEVAYCSIFNFNKCVQRTVSEQAKKKPARPRKPAKVETRKHLDHILKDSHIKLAIEKRQHKYV